MDENQKSIDPEDAGNKKKPPYPLSILFIIGNEFCERFSYYGMKAILVLYFKNVLMYNDDKSTEFYHIFSMACYFTPVLGAIIADSLLGKFRTIFYISILYAIGNIILSYASYLANAAVTWVALVAIALGTGGIKPCVSAFGGDQFGPGQEAQLQKFFSFFYISINAGSLLSTFITPILREDVHCFVGPGCYPLAFGVPAILMIVSLCLFILGYFVTKYVIVPPSKGNIVVTTVKCVFVSLGRKIKNFFICGVKKEHWLDYADDKCDRKTLNDIKAVMRVLFLYLPLPIFWALFDQQGSRWTLQATKMDGNFFGVYRLKPDQIQVVNPLLIILLIPVFEFGVYPLFAKLNILKKPLQRMTTGGILAAVAFVICALIQMKVESEQPVELNANSVHFGVVNGLNTSITFKNTRLQNDPIVFDSYGMKVYENIPINEWNETLVTIVITGSGVNGCPTGQTYTVTPNNTVKDGAILFITESLCTDQKLQIYDFPDILTKPEEGGANTGIVFNIKNYDITQSKGYFFLNNTDFDNDIHPNNGSVEYLNEISTGVADYQEIEITSGGEYSLYLKDQNTLNATEIPGSLDFKQGASYLLIVIGDANDNTSFAYRMHELVQPNSFSMFFQIIQYTVITAGEIMFSITGLEFSYSQAPKSMKSVLQAAWLLTVAFGNLIVVIISSAKIFNKQSYEFFFFAGLMVADMCVFAIMAYFYVPNDPTLLDEDIQENENLKPNKSENINGNGKEYTNGSPSSKPVLNSQISTEDGTRF